MGDSRIVAYDLLHFYVRVLVLNHSKSQNEHDVYFTLTTSKGRLIRDNTLGIYAFSDHQYRRDDFAPILSYSHGPFQDMVIEMKYSELLEQNGEVQIMLTFGGREAPMKYSDYKLSFNSIPDNRVGGVNAMKDMFTVESRLNINTGNTDLSEEERVRSILE